MGAASLAGMFFKGRIGKTVSGKPRDKRSEDSERLLRNCLQITDASL